MDVLFATDVATGVGVGAMRIGVRSARTAARITRHAVAPVVPLATHALRPPFVSRAYWPETVMRGVAARGAEQRATLVAAAGTRGRAVLPRLLDAVLDQIDITGLVTQRVDLDAVAKGIDLDAAVARVDVDAVVDRVNLQRIIDRIDVTAIVARVDVDGVVDRVDIDSVIDRVDLLALARYIIDGVDLPEIIRESTGSVASEGIRELRMQTIDADERVNRLVDRMLLRRHGRRTEAPGEGGPSPDGERPNTTDAP